MTSSSSPSPGVEQYEVLAAEEEANACFELRKYALRYEMVYLRRRVGGGWYVKDSIGCAAQSDEREAD